MLRAKVAALAPAPSKGDTGLYGVAGATGCANPSFTIAALAERCMDALVPEVIDGRSKVLTAA